MKSALHQLLLILMFTSVGFSRDGQAQDVLERLVSVRMDNVEIRRVLNTLEKSTGVKFVYSPKAIGANRKISVRVSNQRLSDVLETVFKPLHIAYRMVGGQILLHSEAIVSDSDAFLLPGTLPINSIDALISGTVTDEKGSGLPGVNVVLKGAQRGTTTDAQGQFSLSVPDAGAVLVFSFLGYITKEVAVGKQTTLAVVLQASEQSLNEVVVVGYGTQRKGDVTGSVASIKGRDLMQVPAPNAIQSLQGLVSGVDIANTSNVPGAAPQIRIRGNRSINATNEPLLVVDGLPFSGTLNDLNSADIKSMEILKDASATAIYGSRGANGVVLITTNRGTAGKIQVSYNGYYGVQQPLNKPRLMNGPEFAEFVREALRNTNRYNSPTPLKDLDKNMFFYNDAGVDASIQAGYDAGGNYNPASVRSYDWVDAVTRSGSMQDHQLSVQAGSEKTQTSFSLGYFSNEGVVKGNGFDRWNLRLTLDNQLSRRFKIGGTAATSINATRSTLNLYSQAQYINPLAPIYDNDGNLVPIPGSDPLFPNPLISLDGVINRTNSTRFYGNFFLEAGLLDGLRYRLSFSPDYRQSRSGGFTNSAANLGSPSSASYSTNQQFHYVIDNMLIYDKELAGTHRLGVTLLQSLEKDRFESITGAVNDLPYDAQWFYNLGTANTVRSLTSGLSEWALSSVMARVNYGYKGKYLLTITGRYDGSSRLAPGNKWSFFPSAALAWNVAEEPFIRNLNTFTELKFRASYGMTGNTAIAPYQTQGGLSRSVYATDDNPAYGFQPNLITNPRLGWEKTKQLDFGLDFGLLNDRLTGTLDIYQQNTVDLLLARQLPTASGFNSIIENIGATRNRGIELSLRGVVMDKPSSRFRWTHQVTFFQNKEEIVSLYNGAVDDIGNQWFIGYPIKTFYDFKKVGIFQNSDADKALITQYNSKGGSFASGLIKVQDTNGDGVINALDRTILGSEVPRWVGSLNTSLEYQGFDLNFLIFTRQGQFIYDPQNLTYQGRNNWFKVDYWTPNNPTNAFPKPIYGVGTPDYGNTLAYQEGSFVRVRNVTLGYRLPVAVQNRLRTANFRIYVSALNPLLFTRFRGIDPEGSTGLTAPSVTTYMTGLNITF